MMNETYDPQAIELQAQTHWETEQSYKVKEDLGIEKFYCLSMFPYPSGNLHMGHVRNYTIGDVIARYQRMLGKNVLQPMGWDAFGLPAENAAIKNNTLPAKWTYENIDSMRAQFQRLGFAYDWSRELATCDPSYYRWEQWLFLQLYQKDLVYKKNALVNWDPVDQTVLANEQVVDGKGWRSGAPVEQREIPQWFLKITDYADELLKDLDTLEHWPEQVKTMQRNWIGRSQGVEINFKVDDRDTVLTTYTTRVDTLMGITFLVIAPMHPLVQTLIQDNPTLAKFVECASHVKVSEAALATLEKEGMDTGLTVSHPITGKSIPLWVANYVIMEYGTGVVQAVPAHDTRDYEFAKQYNFPIIEVLTPDDGSDWDITTQGAFTGKGRLINSRQFTGLTTDEALQEIGTFLSERDLGQFKTHYRLRDWGVSRQRYWGTPIPIIYCEPCGTVPVPEQDLPVVLPQTVELDGAHSPLAEHPDFINVNCPKCGQPARRETDTFDTFVESSWYYARYASHNQDSCMLDERAKYWTPVDQYVGGIEHAVMHLLYARFFHKVLRDEGFLNSPEPFLRLLTQGMVLKDGCKMSKSKGNIVDPTDLISQYGADTVRLFTMFAAPPEQSLEWSDTGVEGASRFLRKLWQCVTSQQAMIHAHNTQLTRDEKNTSDWTQAPKAIKTHRRSVHRILEQACYDVERQQFNTVVSAAMKILNTLQPILKEAQRNDWTNAFISETISILLRLLTPITPHITHALWQACAYEGEVIHAPWPRVDQNALQAEEVTLVVQVNGKLRSKITVPANADNTVIEALAYKDATVQKYLENQVAKKCIVIPNKLVNIVI